MCNKFTTFLHVLIKQKFNVILNKYNYQLTDDIIMIYPNQNKIIEFIKNSVLLFLLIVVNSAVYSQINVQHISGGSNFSSKQGFVYALPKTALQIDVNIKKTTYYSGPYAEYAAKYLDLENVITTNQDRYEITSASLSSYAIPDYEQFYFLEIGDKAKDEKSLLLSLSEAGLIMGVSATESKAAIKGMIKEKVDSEFDMFSYFAAPNLQETTDTIIKKVVVDTISVEKMYFDKRWVEKSDEQKAVEASNMISKIRESRYNLLSGYHEVAYESGSIAYMDKELKLLEQEYLSLFTGITVSRELHYTFSVVPNPASESSLIPVFVFSDKSGVKDVNASGGEKIYLRVTTSGTAEQVKSAIASTLASGKSQNGFFYRIPEMVSISLELNNDIKIEEQFYLSQYGNVSVLPATISTVQFHETTGGIKSMVVE